MNLEDTSMGEKQVELKRTLDTKLLLLQAVGGIFGGGLYGMSGTMIGLTGDAVWLPMVILFFISLMDAFIFMEFAGCYPKMASSFLYIKEGFGGKGGEAISWIVNMYGTFSAPMSSVFIIMTAAGYLSSFFAIFKLWDPGIVVTTFVLWTAAFGLQLWGVQESVIVGDIMSVMEMGMVILLIGIGFLFPTRSPDYLTMPTIAGLAQCLAMAKFAYGGYATPTYYIEETKEPVFKNVWNAVMGSLMFTLFGYVCAVVAMVRMNPPSVVAFAPNPFVASTAGILGGVAPLVFAILGTPAAYNGGLFGLGTRARLVAGMAREGSLPKFFGKIWAKRGTPWAAICLVYLAGMPFVIIGRFAWLVLATAASSLVLSTVVGFAFVAFNLRHVVPEDKKVWRSPLKIGSIALPGLIVSIFCILTAFYQNPDSWVPSGIYMGVAAVLFVIWSMTGGKKQKKD
jgi:amino acid transporter